MSFDKVSGVLIHVSSAVEEKRSGFYDRELLSQNPFRALKSIWGGGGLPDNIMLNEIIKRKRILVMNAV